MSTPATEFEHQSVGADEVAQHLVWQALKPEEIYDPDGTLKHEAFLWGEPVSHAHKDWKTFPISRWVRLLAPCPEYRYIFPERSSVEVLAETRLAAISLQGSVVGLISTGMPGGIRLGALTS